MKMCEMIIDDRGRKCGRRAEIKRIMVRGPGFKTPEPRFACGRCRGEEKTVVKPQRAKALRPLCPVCTKWEGCVSGICHACQNALSYHCRTYPDRLPLAGTVAQRALKHIRPESVAGFKQGTTILYLKGLLGAS
jgi:hypothetical protein